MKSDLVIDSGFPKKIFDSHGVVIGDNKGLITCGRWNVQTVFKDEYKFFVLFKKKVLPPPRVVTGRQISCFWHVWHVLIHTIIFYTIFPAPWPGIGYRTDGFSRRQRWNSKNATTDSSIMRCFVSSYGSFLKADWNVRGRAKMTKDIKYGCQILIKSKITRYFDVFSMISGWNFYEKSKLLFLFCVSVSGIKWIGQILTVFEPVFKW